MPCPTKANKPKGIIISFSLIFAAGLAIYENPQVRAWVDDNRRRVAIALHSLGDEITPGSPSRDASPDASIREAEDPDAVERRRRARQEILERGRILEERRRSRGEGKGKGKTSFDELVHRDGSLKSGEEVEATTTATEPVPQDPGLRHRGRTDSQAAALGSVFANPFTDEMHMMDSPSTLHSSTNEPANTISSEPPSRSQTPTLPTSPTSPPVPPKPEAYQPQRLLIPTSPTSNHPSEQLLDLTPTTTTTASSAATDLAELNNQQQPAQSSNYWSVNEWAETHAAAFQSPREVKSDGAAGYETVAEASEAGTGEHASQAGTEDLDVLSDDVGISTPGSWTEVGSQVSEDF
ncbi:hypothetical protein MMC21_006180 [Puttea exsequens]|nr:hypothetical protein [Puttea exsequens]